MNGMHKVAATVEVAPISGSDIETFSIWFQICTIMGVPSIWGGPKLPCSAIFDVPTVAKATASIEKTLKNDPQHRDYYSAALYYLQEGQDLNQAERGWKKPLKAKMMRIGTSVSTLLSWRD